MKLRIGTRGSDLALWQARHVAALLAAEPGVAVELVVLQTRGDVIEDVPLQTIEGKAFFTAEIELALLEGRVDLAVHSHKDLATQSPAGLRVVAIPPRASPAERLLVHPGAYDAGAAFLPLRTGARVGTSAPRRCEQLRALRPDLRTLDLRGNVPTRVRKLREGHYDAIVLAAAGLERLALDTGDLVSVQLSPALFTPAPAQGALAVQVRASERELIELCRARLHAPAAAECVEAERAVLIAVGGGCNLPLGVLIEPAPIPSPHPPGETFEALPGDMPARENFLAQAFLGPDQPRAGLLARWARATGPDPASAAARLRDVLMAGRATGCGPLAGLRIALTGSGSAPDEPAELAARLLTLGAALEHERVIEFEDLDAGAALAARLAALRPGDALALTSRRAARALAGQGLPAGVLLAAVGPGSARALAAAGHSAGHIGRGGAADLARTLPLAPGARVLFPCAEDARAELEREFAARGVEVERLALYRTRALPRAQLVEGVDARIYMSPSSVDAARAAEALQAFPAPRIALGPVTAEALDARGLAHLALEAGPDLVESVIWTLARLARESAACTPIPTP